MNVKETREALIALGFVPGIAEEFIRNEIDERKENAKNELLRTMTVTGET